MNPGRPQVKLGGADHPAALQFANSQFAIAMKRPAAAAALLKARLLPTVPSTILRSPLSTSPARFSAPATTNRIYDPIRHPTDLETLLLLSSSTRTPLVTLFKTSFCRSCAAVSPLIRSVIESTQETGFQGKHVGYAEVELDAPDAGELAMRYAIRSVPTLMAFDRREAQTQTSVIDVEKLKSENWLREWLEKEAGRGGEGGAGGSLFGGLLGKG